MRERMRECDQHRESERERKCVYEEAKNLCERSEREESA